VVTFLTTEIDSYLYQLPHMRPMPHTKNVDFLRDVGLTEAESRVYLCLLQEGTLKAGRISKVLGLHRRSVYDAIDRLRQKGLISYIKTNNINSYEAADPNQLLTLLKEKEKNLQSILPDLAGLKNIVSEKKETLFFRGKASLKTIFNDQLETLEDGGEICIIGADADTGEVLKYYFPKFNLQRKKQKITVRMIIDESAKKDSSLKNLPLTKIKFAPFKEGKKVATYIYGSHVSIVKWDAEPIAILIKEEEIAKRYKEYFEMMWK